MSSSSRVGGRAASAFRSARFWRRALVLAVLVVMLSCGRKWLVEFPQWRARLALASREPSGALYWLEIADWLRAEDGETEFLRARAHRKAGRFDLVRAPIARAMKLGYPRARLQREQILAQAQAGQLRDAEPYLADLLIDPQGDELEICEAFTNGYLLNSRLPEAHQLLKTWSSDFPDDPLPHLIRGKLFAQASQHKAAEHSFLRALTLRPNDHEAAYELARVMVSQQRPDAALSNFQTAAVEPSLRAKACAGQAACLRVLGRSDEARALLETWLNRDPVPAEVLIELGRLNLDDRRAAEAVLVLQQAFAQRPRDYETRYVLATALRDAGRVEAATEHFDWCNTAQTELTRASTLSEIVRQTPHDVRARFEIGRIHLEYGDPTEAIKWLHGVLDLDPAYTAAHELLAQYYEERADDQPQYVELARRHRKAAARTLVPESRGPRLNETVP